MNFISKLYFGAFKQTGELHLCFILSCLFGGISLYTWFTYYWLEWNEIWWVGFWFYLPFFIIWPISFIVDGYKQDKKKKK